MTKPADACPGVLATHAAADGALARIRLPGGQLSAAQLLVLADCAERFGDGAAHLTSRGNIQLRGLPGDTSALASLLASAGLLPAPSHERVRNFLASPLSGLAGGLLDVRALVRELDSAVCGTAELAGLPGRFLFALDDGRGDVAGERPDVCWRAVDPATGALLLAGADTGVRVPRDGAVDALVGVAVRFLTVRAAAWRVGELPDPGVLVDGRATPSHFVDSPSVSPGVFEREDGRRGMCIAPLFGRLSAEQMRRIAGAAPDVLVTPWRQIVLSEVTDIAAVESIDSPLPEISACIGSPGCAKSHADVRADARLAPEGVRAHFSGCERRCGAPRGAHVDVLATDNGYVVGGTRVSPDELVESLAGKNSVQRKGSR